MGRKNRLLFLLPLCMLFVGCHQSVSMDFSLVYYAGEGGTIIEAGNDIQVVYRGHDGVPVTAKPNEGYVFVAWSDGVEADTRQEKNVQSNLSVTAFFTLKETEA